MTPQSKPTPDPNGFELQDDGVVTSATPVVSDELGNQIDEIMFNAMGADGWNGSTKSYVYVDAKKALTQLITSYASKREIDIRIDELQKLDDDYQTDMQDWGNEHPGFTTAMIPCDDLWARRDALKKQGDSHE